MSDLELELELRRQEAFDVAWRFLAHRDRTEAEVRRNFERKRVDPVLAHDVLGQLREGGYLDDAGFARRFAEDRRGLDGWGAERIERRLAELGIDPEHIRAAVAAGGHDELDAACVLLARRFLTAPETPRDRDRALGFLVRKGYELELARDAAAPPCRRRRRVLSRPRAAVARCVRAAPVLRSAQRQNGSVRALRKLQQIIHFKSDYPAASAMTVTTHDPGRERPPCRRPRPARTLRTSP